MNIKFNSQFILLIFYIIMGIGYLIGKVNIVGFIALTIILSLLFDYLK